MQGPAAARLAQHSSTATTETRQVRAIVLLWMCWLKGVVAIEIGEELLLSD
jgi:hypothetical protein